MTSTSGSPPAAYFMNNEDEVKRLSYNHEIIKAGMGDKLILAPIDLSSPPVKILDSATADGLWLRDISTALLSSSNHTFVGTDLLATSFPLNPPPNFTYYVQDINKPWPSSFEKQFDLVHQRLGLSSSGPATKYVVNNMCELVKPGGWIQLIEAEDKVCEEDGEKWKYAVQVMRDIFTSVGTRYGVIEDAKKWLEEFGFVDIEELVFETRFGKKNGDGRLNEMGVWASGKSIEGLVRFAKTLPQENLSISKEKLETLAGEVQEEAKTQGHSMFMRSVWGRRKEC